MKKITLIQLMLLLYASSFYAQEIHQNHATEISGGTHKRVKIFKNNPDTSSLLNSIGIDMVCGVIQNDEFLLMELSETELSEIRKNGLTYEVLIEDLTSFYAERAIKELPEAKRELELEKSQASLYRSNSVKDVIINNIGQNDNCSEINWVTPQNYTLGSMGGCLTLTEVIAQLDLMRQLYPNLISAKANASPTNQLTHQGRPIYYVRISDNPDASEAGEPQTLITGMTHSREVSSMMNTIFFMWYVLENYASDPYIKNLVDFSEILFIPVVNPDGLAWNQTIAPSGGGLQRKNLRPGVNDNGTTNANNNLRGVDLNRNFGYYYGGVGSSPTMSSDTYRGTAAFSEPESQIIRDFALNRNIKVALNHHAFSNLLPHPINGNASATTGREDEFAKFCHDLSQYNRYIYGPAPRILYSASGDASDWMTGGTNDGTGSTGSGKATLSVSPENGGASEAASSSGFWPSPTAITAISKRAVRMNFVAINTAGKYAKFHDLTQSGINSHTSNLTFAIERLGQTSANFTLTVTPISSNILSITSPPVQTGMAKLEQRTVTAQLVLRTGIQNNEKIEYKISLSNGDYIIYETTILKYFNPTSLFTDNSETTGTLSNWTLSAAGTWVNSTTSSFNGTRSISDSGVAYANNLNKSITTNNGVVGSLAGASKVLVQFYTKWDLERNYDFVQIQGSTDGTNWTSLCGNYTKPSATLATTGHATDTSTKNATSNGFQGNQSGGGVLYDGDQMDKWKMEEIVIDANNNSFLVGATAPRFRFLMRTDSSNFAESYTTSFDGFYFDDFKVIKIADFTPAACSISTTWNGSVWTNGLPNKDIGVVIAGTYSSTADLEACSLTINNNANVIVNSGHDLHITGVVNVASGSTLTFENNANLVQTSNVTNIGNITVKRNSAPIIRLDYTYWSSPVANQNIFNFAVGTLTNRIYEIHEPTNSFIAPTTTNFVAGVGYNIRAPNDYTTTPQTFTGIYNGVPNNGTITRAITKITSGYNLIGNPYPSALNANLFLASNPGTLYFWTHRSQEATSGSNYASYNMLGGTAPSGVAVPNGTIQVGQGFILATASSGTATFTNAMRVGNNQNQFYRAATISEEIEKHRIWLNLSKSETQMNQILLGYMNGATNGIDESIDGKLIDSGSASLYSLIADEKYSIQGRAMPFSASDILPLGIKTELSGTYTIGIDHKDGLFATQPIFLKDNLTGITHDLLTSNYTFAIADGTYNDRFQIVFESMPLNTDAPIFVPESIIAFKENTEINIQSSQKTLQSVKVYDLLGRLLYEKIDVESKNHSIKNLQNSQQVLLLQITLEDNTTHSKKILF